MGVLWSFITFKVLVFPGNAQSFFRYQHLITVALHYTTWTTNNLPVNVQNVTKITSISLTKVAFPLSEWMHLKFFRIEANTLA